MCVILHMSIITQDGWSALMGAAIEGETEDIVELVKAGANVDMQDGVCHAILYIYVTHDTWKYTLAYIQVGREERQPTQTNMHIHVPVHQRLN